MRRLLAILALFVLALILLCITILDIVFMPFGYQVHDRVTNAVLDFGNYLKEELR